MIEIRVGLPTSYRRLSATCNEIGAPMMVSANAFWRGDRFRAVRSDTFNDGDVALDSAGFVAMFRYGKYRWSVRDYVWFAKSYPWTWWAAMDMCCEPEIARDREEVLRRVDGSVKLLWQCQSEALEAYTSRNGPMPVLQGWLPEDYARCAEMMVRPLGEFPELVGIGSICRRHMAGPDGVAAVVNGLDRHMPAHVRFHLFGVKGQAVADLRGHPRIYSIDSMAWDFGARRSKGDSFTIDHRERCMREWYAKHAAAREAPGWSWQMDLVA